MYSPTPEMAIIHKTMHDAIHAVRDQQGRPVTRSLLNQQKAIADSKLQYNIQIKRTLTPEHPLMSNVLPDKQELDRKRPMVSPAAVQRSQIVSHRHLVWLDFKLWRGGLKHQLSPKRKASLTEQLKGKGFSRKPPPKVPQTACPKSIVLPGPPLDWMAQPLKVTEWDHQERRPAVL